MVQVRFMRKLVISAIVLLILAQVVLAEGLEITTIRVYVNSKKESGIDREGGSIDNVRPDSTVEVKVKVKNTYPRSSDEEIENIVVTGTIEEIDDGDDIEEESEEFDLKPGRTKTVTLTFDIPLAVEEETFEFPIKVEGENSTSDLEATALLELEIEKKNHELRFVKAELDDKILSCKDSTNLNVKVVNTGSDDEDDVELTISNDELGIDRKDIIDLDNDPFDKDSTFSQSYLIQLPDNFEPGVYPILIRASYNRGKDAIEKVVKLTVENCKKHKLQPTKTVSVTKEKPETEEVIVKKTQAVPPAATATVVATQQPTFETNKWFIASIIAAYVIVIIIGVLLVIRLFKKE